MRSLLLAMVLACAPLHSAAYDGEPGVASVASVSQDVFVSVSNETTNVLQFYVTDDKGLIVRHIQVGPQLCLHLKIPRSDLHSSLLLFSAGEFLSEPMSVWLFDSFEVRLDVHAVFSTVTGYHGRIT